MIRLSRIAGVVMIMATLGFASGIGVQWPAALTMGVAEAQTASLPCNLSQPAFCDRFDQPFMGSGRTGHLDPTRWSVSRVNGMTNPGGGLLNNFKPSNAMRCMGLRSTAIISRSGRPPRSR